MSTVYSIETIIDRALRKVGAFAIRQAGPRPEEVEEARYWLDMTVAHEASRARTWWLVENSATFLLTTGIDTYNLPSVLGGTQAPDGVQFVVMAVLYDLKTGQDICELPIVRREEWEQRSLPIDLSGIARQRDTDVGGFDSDTPQPAIAPGAPRFCYIDRMQSPTMHISPIPDKGYGIRIVFQGFSPDFIAPATLSRQTKLRSAWNLWIVTALSAQIGNGPIRKLPADEVADMKREAQSLRDDLEAYEAQEQSNVPRVIRYYDGI